MEKDNDTMKTLDNISVVTKVLWDGILKMKRMMSPFRTSMFMGQKKAVKNGIWIFKNLNLNIIDETRPKEVKRRIHLKRNSKAYVKYHLLFINILLPAYTVINS